LNDNGCGDSQFCCYYTDCQDGDENCPTPVGQTYVTMVVAMIICLITAILGCIARKKYY